MTSRRGRAQLSRAILFGLLAALIAVFGSGYGQASSANLYVQSIEFNTGFFLQSPGPPVTIRAIIGNNGSVDMQNYDVSIKVRREDEPSFRADELCQFVGTSSTCKNLSLRVGESTLALGLLATSNLTPGRYIVRVAVDPKGVSQSSQADDSQEALLLIGIQQPEFHPISLTFSPPSPVPLEVQLTVKVEIENTGKPMSPELQVKFEYCLESPTCIEFSAEGFPAEGVRRVTSDQTTPLGQGKPLEVSNTLDTTNLQIGRYTFRVTIKALDVSGNELDEMDKSNNEITTRLTLAPPGAGGLNPPLCQLSGDVITLGRGVGTAQNRLVPVFYVGVKDATGRVTLHAFKKTDVDGLQAGSVCPEITNSPLSLPAEITSFALDQKIKLLYVGLSNGQIVIVNLDNPETLVATSPRTVAASALQSLAPRVAGRTTGEIYAGSRDGNLYRVRVTKDSGGGLTVSSSDTCARIGSPINAVLLFQGNVYSGASSGTVLRTAEGSCSPSQASSFFSAGRAVRVLATNQLVFGRTPAPQVLVGLDDGTLHVLNIFGQDYRGSPLALGAAITALVVNRKDKVAFAGTAIGSLHAIDLSSRLPTCATPFSILTLQAINVLAVDDGGQGDLPGSGVVFAGSDDNNLYVISGKTCTSVTNPRPTSGPIRAGMVLDGIAGFFGFEGINAVYGGGSGLFELTLPLSAIP